MSTIQTLKTVLLIDDDEPTNMIHKLIIKKSGVDVGVQVASSAMQGLSYLTHTNEFEDTHHEAPGIIFLDINMPVMDGWEFLEEYKKLPSSQQAKVVAIMLTTSILRPEQGNNAAGNQAVIYIDKPLTKDKFLKVVNENFAQ